MPAILLFTKMIFEQIRYLRNSSGAVQIGILVLPAILLCVLHLSVTDAQANNRGLYATIGFSSNDISSGNNDLINGISEYTFGGNIGFFIGDHFSIEVRGSRSGNNYTYEGPSLIEIDGTPATVDSSSFSLGVRTYLSSLDKRNWVPWIGIYLSKQSITVREFGSPGPGMIDYDYSAVGPAISIGLDVGVGSVKNEEIFIQTALTYRRVEGDQEMKIGPDVENVESDIIEFTVSFGVY